MSKKPILCLDFDGVLHSYKSGWQGVDVVSDGPVPGAMRFLYRAVDHFEVHIYSTRSSDVDGREAMRNAVLGWLDNEFPPSVCDRVYHALRFPSSKPPAMLTIDDRAVIFTGAFPSPSTLLSFTTWQGR